MRSVLVFVGSYLAVLLAVGLIVRDHAAPVPAPSVVMEIMDPSLERYANAWQKEIARRFPNAVGVLCHGGNFVGDQWICTAKSFERYTTVQDVVRFEQAKYPGKTLVILACNPGHLDLGIPGVYFANDSVFCVPDRAVGDDLEHALLTLDSGLDPALSRWSDAPGVLGNIFEFQSD